LNDEAKKDRKPLSRGWKIFIGVLVVGLLAFGLEGYRQMTIFNCRKVQVQARNTLKMLYIQYKAAGALSDEMPTSDRYRFRAGGEKDLFIAEAIGIAPETEGDRWSINNTGKLISTNNICR